MIIALEGPDKSGKTTALEALRKAHPDLAHYVKAMPLAKELMPVMSYVEHRQVALWDALYNDRHLYICDRHPVVSAEVYDNVFDRPYLVDNKPWRRRLYVVYCAVPLEVLKQRYTAEGDEHFPMEKYEKLLHTYWQVVQKYTGTTVNFDRDVTSIVHELASIALHVKRRYM